MVGCSSRAGPSAVVGFRVESESPQVTFANAVAQQPTNQGKWGLGSSRELKALTVMACRRRRRSGYLGVGILDEVRVAWCATTVRWPRAEFSQKDLRRTPRVHDSALGPRELPTVDWDHGSRDERGVARAEPRSRRGDVLRAPDPLHRIRLRDRRRCSSGSALMRSVMIEPGAIALIRTPRPA